MSATESGAPSKRTFRSRTHDCAISVQQSYKALGAWRSETSGSKTQGGTTYTTLARVLGIQERANGLCLYPGLEHTVLASRASLDEIDNPILLDAIIHSGGFDDPES